MSATVLSSTEVYRGRVFQVVNERVTLENEVSVDLDLIRHPGASAIVAVSEEDQVKLLRQYRHAVGRRIWEIPAGTLEQGEAALSCAKRELAEEAGVDARSWTAIGEIVPVPGYSDERITLFLATGLIPTPQRLDKDELLEVFEIPFSETLAMIDSGEIVDAKTVSALLLAERFWKRNRPQPGQRP